MRNLITCLGSKTFKKIELELQPKSGLGLKLGTKQYILELLLTLRVALHWKNKMHELQFGSKITPELINFFHCLTTFGAESSLMMKKKRPELHLGSHSFGHL